MAFASAADIFYDCDGNASPSRQSCEYAPEPAAAFPGLAALIACPPALRFHYATTSNPNGDLTPSGGLLTPGRKSPV